MPEDDDNDSVILQDGRPAEERFRFAVEKHVLGRTVKGLTYSSAEDVDGQLRTTIRLDFEGGEFLVISVATDAEIDLWVQRDGAPQPISKLIM